MELTLFRASHILKWIGLVFLVSTIFAMALFGFVGSMVTITLLVLEHGGDPSPIFFIVKGVQFLWQLSMVVFFFAVVCYLLGLVARHARVTARRKRWAQEEEFERMKEEILQAVDAKNDVKIDYVDLTNFKPKKRRRK